MEGEAEDAVEECVGSACKYPFRPGREGRKVHILGQFVSFLGFEGQILLGSTVDKFLPFVLPQGTGITLVRVPGLLVCAMHIYRMCSASQLEGDFMKKQKGFSLIEIAGCCRHPIDHLC